MRFIQCWSYALANGLISNLNEGHGKRYTYYYGFQWIIGSIVKCTLLVGISLLLECLMPSLAILIAFAALRTYAGGYHMDTYGKCIAISMVLFISAALLSVYTSQYFPVIIVNGFIIVALVLSLYSIARYAPVDHPNKPITDEDKPKFKRKASICVIVLMATIVGLMYAGYLSLAIAATFGMLLEVSSVTPIGYKFYNLIGNVHK